MPIKGFIKKIEFPVRNLIFLQYIMVFMTSSTRQRQFFATRKIYKLCNSLLYVMIYLQTRDTRSFILKLNKLLDAFDEMESPNTQIYIDIQGKN